MGITLKLGTYTQIDMNDYGPFSGDYGSADITSFSSTKIEGYVDSTKIVIKGSGFKADNDGYLSGGTITSVTQTYGGRTELSLTGISVSVNKLIEVLRTPNTYDERDLVKKVMSGNDKVYGGDYGDVLRGEAGSDTLSGKGGNDKIYGNSGGDTLIGGTGADRLYGGSGADTFVFKKAGDSTIAGAGRDTVYDFSSKEGDRIDLRSIDANGHLGGDQSFKFIGDGHFSGKAGQLRFEKKSGDTFVFGDVNGDGRSDFSIKFDASINFVKGDFLL